MIKRNILFFLILNCAWLSTLSADITLFEGSQKLSGVKISNDPELETNKVAYWENAPKGFRIAMLSKQADLSKYKALSFRFYSKDADGHSVTVLVDSNESTKGNYFSKVIKINWQGWKTVTIPFEDFSITRDVVGWNKVDKILFANSGYGAGKANKAAVYYIDDIKALLKAPESEPLKKDEVVKLTSTESSYSYSFKSDPSKEAIYGIRFEVKGDSSTKIVVNDFRTYDENHKLKEKMEYISYKQSLASEDWQLGRMEILVKKGTGLVQSKIRLSKGDFVDLRNIEVVKGGFPDNPPMKEAPYLDWIDSLKVNFENSKNSPLLKYAKEGAQIWEHKGGRTVTLPDYKFKRFKDNVAPFMGLSVEKLISLVPTKRPFAYSGGTKGTNYFWEPEKSNDIYEAKSRKVYAPEKKFPIHGYEEVVAPSGKKVKYAYHDTKLSDKKYKGRRIYVDQFQTDARLEKITQIGIQLGMLYRRTGEMKYGVRSAAILWAITRNMPDWPVHGKISWNAPQPEIRLQAPDYYSWFSFTMNGYWYVSSAGSLLLPCRYYAILDNTDVWAELSKEVNVKQPQLETANGFLHMARMILKRDAFYRNSKFVMFHNLSGSANRTLAQIGRMIGEPELVHYTLRKILGSFNETFMEDGVFPESQWYTLDQFVRQSQALDIFTDYQDPKGYISPLDNKHLSISNPKTSIPVYKTAVDALNRQTYPDATAYTLHDSWSETANPAKGKLSVTQFDERLENTPHLFRAYGHGALGRGMKPYRIEPQLHFSGTYNHAHYDMLNLNFWAYGDELVSDIGYSHITAYNQSSVSHNLVVVNRGSQKGGDAGRLLTWNARKGSSQIVQADQGGTPAYPECSIYRRSLVLLPFGEKRNAVLDIFEVEGGEEHDWMANGCADYKQVLTTDLNPEKTLDNLAKNGVAITDSYPWGDSQKDKYKHDKYGVESKFYGAFRNANVSSINETWTATMKPTPAVSKNTKSAGPRAKSLDPKPSMKLHWLNPQDGKAILAEAPRNRYSRELHNKLEARKAWSKELMPKIIVNRKGKNLKSTFVALWEPYSKNPFLNKVEKVATKDNKGLAWKISDENITKTVLYRAPEMDSEISAMDVVTDGNFTILSEQGDSQSIDFSGGENFSNNRLKATVKKSKPLEVIEVTRAKSDYSILVKGHTSQISKLYEDQYICFSLENTLNRWFKIKSIRQVGSNSKITLSQDPGFTYDAESKALQQAFFPHRLLSGKAFITLPSWFNFKRIDSAEAVNIKIRASDVLSLSIKNISTEMNIVQFKSKEGIWKRVDSEFEQNKLSFKLNFTTVSDDWLEIKITK